MVNLLSAGVCLAIFVIAFILGLRWSWRALGASGHERLTAFLGSLMGFGFAFGYLVWGIRVLADAIVTFVQPYVLQWGLAFGVAAFCELLWALRLTYLGWISKKKWLYFLPLIATGLFMGLYGYATYYASTAITFGYTGDLAPMVGMATAQQLIGSAVVWVAGFDVIVYMGVVPLFVFFRTRKGELLALKNLLPYLGILLLFIGALLELALRLLTGVDIIVVVARAVIAVALFFLWFK